MGWACGTCGGQERCIQGFGWGDLEERNHFENLDPDGKIILKWISKK
jgi:hypothetical protein